MNENTTIGHYNILSPLGKGGMGEVYLADDTRLDRQVAIKLLPDRLRSDSERLERFRREAKAAAAMKHPNIATIYALEEFDGPDGTSLLLITMEYVDGITLKDAIPDGGMDVGDSNAIGRTQGSPLRFFDVFIPLADALAHAHAQGRIHRDLKPGNIMITEDGIPKILDFGLARIIDPDPIAGDIIPGKQSEPAKALGPNDETRTMDEEEQRKAAEAAEAAKKGIQSLTRGGRLIGTPQYMSPEQAERKETDARTDIFSFGVVAYEALTGQKLFEGESLESIIGRILEAEPKPVTEIKPVTPYTLWTVIRTCLRKDREQRMQTSRQLHADLLAVQQEVNTGTVLVDASTIPEPEPVPEPEPPPPPEPVPLWRQPVGIGAIAMLMLVVGTLGAWLFKPVSEPPLRKFQWEVDGLNWPAISPDGKRVAYVSGNPSRLWIRDLDSTTPREIPDTDGARLPFWSAGSDEVGFMVEDEMRKVAATGGPSLTLHKASRYIGNATWRPDGMIIQRMNRSVGGSDLATVSSQGGEPQVYLEPDSIRGEQWFLAPHVLPDGKTLIFVVVRTDWTYQLVVQVGDSLRVLVGTNRGGFIGSPVYASSGHLVYQRGSGAEANIWALPFDAGSLEATGEPFIAAQKVFDPSVSLDGTLVYRSGSGGGDGQLVWTDKEGQVTGAIGQPKRIGPLSLSPDGRQVAVQAIEQGNNDIWVYDTQRGTATRLTFDEGVDGDPAWSPDGSEVVFISNRNGNLDLYRRQADGSGIVTSLLNTPAIDWAPHWSRDGRYVAYNSGEVGSWDIWAFEPESDGEPFVLFETEHNEIYPTLSPDSRYVAYMSNESGQFEVYVMRFPSGQGRWQVSSEGGRHPRWNGTGTELFFVSGDNMMAVEVSTRGVFQADIPTALFSASTVGAGNLAFSYDVSADGQRFVVVQQADAGETPTITVVENWIREFEEE